MAERNQNEQPARREAQPGQNRQVPRRRRRHSRPIILTILIRIFQVIGTLALIGLVTGSFLACYAAVYVRTAIMPKAELDFSVFTNSENSVIYYIDKETQQPVELKTLVGKENREWVEYDQIPKDLINAIVAIEDKRFWDHNGVDWYRTAGAFVNMFLSMRSTFGASTLTQQTIKVYTTYDDVTVTRKILEIFTALAVDKDYSKEDILEFYLNKIYLGNGCYGIQAAAQFYFGKDVWDLDLAECASIAGITNNPSLYSPYGTVDVTRYPCKECGIYTLDPEEDCESCGAHNYGPGERWTNKEFNKRRQEIILKEMLNEDNGAEPTIFEKIRNFIFGEEEERSYINRLQYEQAVAETLAFTRDQKPQTPDQEDMDGDGVPDSPVTDEDNSDSGETGTVSNINSWYVDAVIREAVKLLMAVTHLDEDSCTYMVYSGGLRIYCAYDPEAQGAVDQIYNDPSNLNYVSRTGQPLISAISVVDNSTGYVVAMGSTQEKTANRGWITPVDTVRQPGSSIKPLSVYGPALEFGLITPATIVDDNPQLLNDQVWPVNVTATYKGLTTVLDAVTRSLNTVALNVLETMVTPQASYDFMVNRFHFTSLVSYMELSNGEIKSDIDRSPLSMGGLTRGLSTFEMAAAYATFPRNGYFTSARTVLRIEDINGKVLVDNTGGSEYIIKEDTAYYMNSLLTNVVSAGTGSGARISGQTVAGKTGTTNNKFDLWFAGYTSYYTAAVWVGYPDYNEVISDSVGTPTVVLWRKVMEILHEGKENQPFPSPTRELRSYNICLDCGKLATEDCANDVRGNRTQTFRLLSGDGPTDPCICHVPVTICMESPIEGTSRYHLATEFCPEETRREVYVVDYERVLAKETVVVGDADALLSFYAAMGDDAYCTVHDETWVDPNAPPSEDPNGEPSEGPWWPWWPTESPDVSESIPPESAPPVSEPPVTEPSTEPSMPPSEEPTADPEPEESEEPPYVPAVDPE